MRVDGDVVGVYRRLGYTYKWVCIAVCDTHTGRGLTLVCIADSDTHTNWVCIADWDTHIVYSLEDTEGISLWCVSQTGIHIQMGVYRTLRYTYCIELVSRGTLLGFVSQTEIHIQMGVYLSLRYTIHRHCMSGADTLSCLIISEHSGRRPQSFKTSQTDAGWILWGRAALATVLCARHEGRHYQTHDWLYDNKHDCPCRIRFSKTREQGLSHHTHFLNHRDGMISERQTLGCRQGIPNRNPHPNWRGLLIGIPTKSVWKSNHRGFPIGIPTQIAWGFITGTPTKPECWSQHWNRLRPRSFSIILLHLLDLCIVQTLFWIEL